MFQETGPDKTHFPETTEFPPALKEIGLELGAVIDLAGEKAKELDLQVKDMGEAKEGFIKKAESVAARFREAIGVYVRLIIFGGLVMMAIPGENKSVAASENFDFETRAAIARQELATKGITSDQEIAYSSLSDILNKGIMPLGYYEGIVISDFMRNLAKGKYNWSHPDYGTSRDNPDLFRKEMLSREDAWRFYLGLPQQNNTFGISEYQPKKSKDKKAYYYNIKDFWKKYINSEKSIIKTIVNTCEKNGGKFAANDPFGARQTPGIMAEYKLSCDKDQKGSYISYYDYWNLDISPEGDDGFFGKPYEIYDRLYYDPQTFKPIHNPDVRI